MDYRTHSACCMHWHLVVLKNRVNCSYYSLFSQFLCELFTFFIYLRYFCDFWLEAHLPQEIFPDVLNWGSILGQAVSCQSRPSGPDLAEAHWSQTHRTHGQSSQSLAVADGTSLAPRFTRAGQHVCQVSFPVSCCGSHLLCSLGKTSLFLTRRSAFLVFKHRWAENCILVLFPVLFI